MNRPLETLERSRARATGSRAAAVVLVVLLLGALARATVVETVRVSSDSMAPTICTGGVVLVATGHPGSVRVDDVVTFPSPADGSPTIKRVVAVAGQQVAIEDAVLVRDGQQVAEPYVDRHTIDGVYYGPVTVPAGAVLVMGDHRETSIDSRSYGPVPVAAIDGRRLLTLWPSC
jgi:signal peptidase I